MNRTKNITNKISRATKAQTMANNRCKRKRIINRNRIFVDVFVRINQELSSHQFPYFYE